MTTSRDEDDALTAVSFMLQLGDGVKLDGFFGKAQGCGLMAALNGRLKGSGATPTR